MFGRLFLKHHYYVGAIPCGCPYVVLIYARSLLKLEIDWGTKNFLDYIIPAEFVKEIFAKIVFLHFQVVKNAHFFYAF